jgi:hypothetical protein
MKYWLLIFCIHPLFAQDTIYFENFAKAKILKAMHAEKATTYSSTVTQDKCFSCPGALRIELRNTDAKVSNGTRSEVYFEPARHKEQWYTFKAYFPAQDFPPDTSAETITQWHQWPDKELKEKWRSPTTSMYIKKGHLWVNIGYNTAKVSKVSEKITRYDLGELVKDQWNTFTFHLIHSPFEDGLFEVYLNEKLVVHHQGGNMHNDQLLPFWKIGLYKWSWNEGKTKQTGKRIYYLDDVGIFTQHP